MPGKQRVIVGRKLNAGRGDIGAEILHHTRAQARKFRSSSASLADGNIVARLIVAVEASERLAIQWILRPKVFAAASSAGYSG